VGVEAPLPLKHPVFRGDHNQRVNQRYPNAELSVLSSLFSIRSASRVAAEEDVRCADDGPFFIGRDGKTIKVDQLPTRGLKHWRPHDKPMIVAAERRGLRTVAQVNERAYRQECFWV